MKIEGSDKSTAKNLVAELLRAKKELVASKTILNKKDKHLYPITNPPFEIPKNWQWVFLSDISIIQEGPGIRKHQYQDEGIQFLTVTNILEGSVDLLKSQKFVSLEEFNKKYIHYSINKGDIVTACSGASWGKSAIYHHDNQLMLNTSTLRLRFFRDLGVNKYLYYLTKSVYFKYNLASHSTGQQANYGYSHYSKIPIPIPPLPEQKQIVAILDQAFAAINQAKANIEKNIQNAKELFQSKLNAIFSQKGDGWEEKQMDEICEITSKLINPQDPECQDLLHVGGGNIVAETGELIDLKTSKEEGLKSGKFAFDNSVVLYNKIRPYLVKVSRPDFNGLCSADMYPLSPIKKEITRDFLYFLLVSKDFTDYAIKGSARAGMPKVNRKHLFAYRFSLPSVEIQNILLKDLDFLRMKCRELDLEYSKKLQNLEELKKSLLQKAFAGELTQAKATA